MALSSKPEIHPSYRVQLASLFANNTFITVLSKYADFAVVKHSEYIKINNYLINLVDGQQSLYGSIYSLRPVQLETLKTYIETNLVYGFI